VAYEGSLSICGVFATAHFIPADEEKVEAIDTKIVPE
jgi:hypothetical protein